MTTAVSTAAQCRSLDAAAIDAGVPGIALMEIASRGVAQAIVERFAAQAARGVLVVCGGGNNGGDGYAAARWLALDGYPVYVESLCASSSGDAAVMRSAAANHGIGDPPEGLRPGVVVDAVFGTGLTREVQGRYAERLCEIDQSDAVVVAVDLPSGLHADTGQVLGVAPRADLTVTFGRLKPAFFTSGRDRCGEIVCVDIGVDRHAHTLAQVITTDMLVWPERPARAHKNRLGHLGVVAGSARYAGAAILACKGALAGGCGLVTLFAPADARSRLVALPPEVMLVDADLGEALQRAQQLDAVAVGPGLDPAECLHHRADLDALFASDVPVVADASALHPVDHARNTVFTPHPGEAGRMLGCSSTDVEADRFAASRGLPGCSVLKGAYSLVHLDGQQRISPFCTSTLATGGSGDVLTGLIGALLARGCTVFDAACAGVWVHGRAGERLADLRLEGWTASDIAAEIPWASSDI